MTPTYPNGTTELGGWTPHERALAISQLCVGDLLLQESARFQAQNLVRITGVDLGRGIAYGVFADPLDPARLRQADDLEFAIWGHELTAGDTTYLRLRRDAMPYTPPEVHEKTRALVADLLTLCQQAGVAAFPADDRPRLQRTMAALDELVFPGRAVTIKPSHRRPRGGRP